MAYYTEEHGVLAIDGGMGSIFSKIKDKVQGTARKIIGAGGRSSGGLVSTSTDRYKWPGGKSGDVDEHGIPYGTKMADAIAMLARASVANPDVPPEQVTAAPAPAAATPAVPAPAVAPLPASAPALPAGAPYGDEGAGQPIDAVSTTTDAGGETNWKLILGLGAAAAALYFMSRRK